MEIRLFMMRLQTEQDVVLSRNRARLIAQQLQFSAQDGVRIATAVSEIARNAFRYARDGVVEFGVESSRRAPTHAFHQSFVITVRDRGSGIVDLETILAGRYRSATGMGIGLIGSRRLMDEVTIDTGPAGTVVRLTKVFPANVIFNSSQLQSIGDLVSRDRPLDPLEELATQNRDLISTLADLKTHREQLETINDELSETNRGVVALYDELDTVYRVGRVVASKLDLDSLLQAITDATTDVSGAELGSFFYRDPETRAITCHTAAGPLRNIVQGCTPATMESLVGPHSESVEVCRVDDMLEQDAIPPLGDIPLRSYLSVPVRDSLGELAGALVFGHRTPNAFSERTERILTSVAVQASIGIENARLYRNVQAASAAKDQFLAVLSHELRTPLNPVFAILASLEDRAELPEEVRSDLVIMKRNLQLEARLIDDLLDLTRIVKGKVPLLHERADLHQLIYAACQTCEPAILRQDVKLQLNLTARRHHVIGDAARLQQVLWNLVSNAVKFTPSSGTVTISTSTEPQGDIAIRIADTGRGIEAAVLEKIFHPFEQGDQAVTSRFGGLGLGLAISKSIVDAHGGSIRAESGGTGLGSTFVVTLPLADAASENPEARAVAQPARGAVSAKILLVDDHEDTRETLRRLLARRGHDITTASSCAHALEVAASDQFDLVISDLGLPDGSGHDLMPRLRERGIKTGIALSGFGMEADLERSHAVGFFAHLIKPLDFPVLESTIEKALAR